GQQLASRSRDAVVPSRDRTERRPSSLSSMQGQRVEELEAPEAQPSEVAPVSGVRPRARGVESDLARLRPIVDATLRRFLGKRDPEYEDVLQSSLEGLLVALGRRGPDGESPSASWAAVIARNITVDALRARARARRLFVLGEWGETLPCEPGTVEPEHLAA